ncbi:sensor histidine kinase, partial [Muriicola sp.]|uniref:sensor histidine kinase n=1 Tax=Muriicola sp. TaxID=2020856 RepID=UPI00356AB6E3
MLIRFAKVFEQTYTRFLDLQKAEAQAREVEIQLALERIRSRAMAMHSTDELGDVLCVLFEQFDFLGIKPVLTHLTLFDEENDNFSLRITTSPKNKVLVEQILDVDAMESWKVAYENWKKGGEYTVDCIEYPPESLPEVWKVLHLVMNSLPDEYKIYPEDFPNGLFTTQGHCKYGYIGMNHNRPASEEEKTIVARFAREFGVVYQRFLELKKAEEQAREAQIEAALESVRAKTMAMHNTEDIAVTVTTFFNELLGLHPDSSLRCGIGILSQAEHMELWTASVKGDSDTVLHSGTLDMSLHPLLKGVKETWKSKKSFFAYTLKGKDVKQYFKILNAAPDYPVQFNLDTLPGEVYHNSLVFQDGVLFAFTEAPLQEDIRKVLERFAVVFGQTYTRYLDLQKAEAQAREAQIEAALERVRARSMAMHSTDEMQQVANAVYDQLAELGVEMDAVGMSGVIEAEQDYDVWVGGAPMGKALRIPYNEDSEVQRDYNKAIKDRTELFAKTYMGKVKEEYIRNLLTHGNFPRTLETKMKTSEAFTTSIAFAKNSGIQIVRYTNEPYLQEDNEVLKRFAQVFEQAYIRFRDLQKAEAQAREAQIEAALERIRSHVTGMQESSELLDIVVTMRSEFIRLGHEAHYFWHMRWLPDTYQKAMTSGDGTRIGMVMKLPRHIHGDVPLLAKWEKSKEPTVVYAMDADAAVDYVDKMVSLGDFQQVDPQAPSADDIRKIGGLTFVMARTTHGEIGYSLPGVVPNPPAEDINTLVRFAGVFDLAYRRFEDLKESERQKREAEIELALERVRARTMAMQHSDELAEASHLLDKEVRALGIETWGCAFNIYRQNDSIEWFGNEAGILPTYTVPRNGIFKQYYEMGQGGESLFIKEFAGEECVAHYEYMSTLPVVGDVLRQLKETNEAFPTYQIDHVVYFKYGYLLFITREAVPEAHDIFKRFASVFEQTYTRFLDLQKAEAQAKEAVKQASIDRIRGQIASMRTAKDLERITPLIWNELTVLGVPFIRCGVFIVHESDKTVQAFLSAPDGKSLGAMRIPFDADKDTAATVAHWKKREVYRTHWDKEQFLEFMETMMNLGQVSNKKEYQGAEEPPESLFLHFLPFKQGMLYVGNTKSLDQEQMEAVGSLADAFSIAYARYEDFVKLEKAKERIERTLGELRETQKQLVHSEKMASLGELTAGIAHEIQNPLNFVNNFSEVSKELIEEMLEEIQKGDVEEAKALAEDIVQNLEKIHHHGQRADGIVKGMLQHSRGSSGEKEPTDINVLADEYLRLAYHGLRAKDKSFNATLETQFDESLGKVHVV